MSAAHDFLPPGARLLLDRHFGTEALAQTLGTSSEAAARLTRKATWEPIAALLSRRGKQVRARMVEHAHAIIRESHGAAITPILPPDLPYVVELLHEGSLIVDDIQDGSITRRGAPALHTVVGTARAINMGNFLYFLPIVLLEEMRLEPLAALAIHGAFAKCLVRCHHGQGLDLAMRASELAHSEIRQSVELATSLKTGALFQLACAIGSITAGATDQQRDVLDRFAREAGIALQMMDDFSSILVKERRQKGIEDLEADRPTWVWATLSVAMDRNDFLVLQKRARLVSRGQASAEFLVSEIAQALAPHAKQPAKRWRNAIRELEAAFGKMESITRLVTELGQLEGGYGLSR